MENLLGATDSQSGYVDRIRRSLRWIAVGACHHKTPLPGVAPENRSEFYVGDYYVNEAMRMLCPGVL